MAETSGLMLRSCSESFDMEKGSLEKKGGWKEFWRGRGRSFRFAWAGIKTLFRHEANARFHLGAACAVIVAGFLFSISTIEWCVVILCIAAMFMAEGLNTALEKLCDKVSPEYDPLIGKAKDLAAGAVLMMAAGCVAVGLIIFIPKIVSLIAE